LLWVAIVGAIAVPAIYFLDGGFQSARSDYVRAREFLSQDPARSERFAERAVLNAGGDYPEAQLLQCRALAATGQWDAALGGFSLIKNFSTCDAADLVALGEAALHVSQWKLASMSLEEAAKKPGTDSARAIELLVSLDLRFGHRDVALKRCREWQRTAPLASRPWALAGDIESLTANFGTAIGDYREALRRAPDPQSAMELRATLAQSLIHNGDTSAARKEFEILLASGPLTSKASLGYSQLLRMEGRQAEALEVLDRQISQTGATAESLKLRGILYLDDGKLELAIKDLKESVRSNPFDIGAQHKLGQAYLQSGDPDSAKPYLEKSQKMIEATFRIPELHDLLRERPNQPELQEELKSLNKIMGR
jgi:tetratricopeptide (TPR) repeat protein